MGFIFFLLIIRRLAYGSQSSASQSNLSSIQSAHSAPHLIYAGMDVSNDLSHLVIVPGHAIWNGGLNYTEDSDWMLEPFQHGQTDAFVEQIKAGAALVASSPNTLLVFSGSESRQNANGKSEAQSYQRLLVRFVDQAEVPPLSLERVTTEQFARDSYENLLFSIARFYEVAGEYPKEITVIGYTFKKQRYIDLHRAAVKFPLDRFHYIGIDPASLDLQDAERGEKENARSLYERDLYGCHNKKLMEKKKLRNPARRRHGYELSNRLLAPLIEYCPISGNQLYADPLPWT